MVVSFLDSFPLFYTPIRVEGVTRYRSKKSNVFNDFFVDGNTPTCYRSEKSRSRSTAQSEKLGNSVNALPRSSIRCSALPTTIFLPPGRKRRGFEKNLFSGLDAFCYIAISE